MYVGSRIQDFRANFFERADILVLGLSHKIVVKVVGAVLSLSVRRHGKVFCRGIGRFGG